MNDNSYVLFRSPAYAGLYFARNLYLQLNHRTSRFLTSVRNDIYVEPLRDLRFISTLVFSLLLMSLPNTAWTVEISIKNVLPASGFAEKWAIEDEVKLFDKDNLFDHINGEAELYFPYGFDSLAAANYINQENLDLSIVADVYKMGSLLDAFGIYSNYRKPNNSWVAIGAEGFVSASQLMFYQDRYFVRLQVSGETNLPQEILIKFAQAISGRLPEGALQPKELDILKIAVLVPKSERYLAQSLLGYAFFRKGTIADALVQNEKMQIFAICEDTPAAARKTFEQYYSYLKAEGQGIQLSEKAGQRLVIADDPLYGGIQVMQSGRYIIGTVRVKNNTIAGNVLEQLQKQITADGVK
ncbi:MAG: DUF6599 family protein [Smithellaceae bacterium]